MATFTVTHHQRVNDYAVVQTLETTDIGVGQTITLAGLGNGLDGAQTVFAVPTYLLLGVDDQGDPFYDYEQVILNQLMFVDAGDDLPRSAADPFGTLTWSQTCTWVTSADVQVFLGISSATANDTAFLTQAVAAGNQWCFKRRQQAGYHDSLTTVPDNAVKMGCVLYCAGIYRERGSIDSFQSFSDMGAGTATLNLGRIHQLLGVKRSQVA